MSTNDSIVKVDNSATEFGPDRYGYPLYDFPLSATGYWNQRGREYREMVGDVVAPGKVKGY